MAVIKKTQKQYAVIYKISTAWDVGNSVNGKHVGQMENQT